MKELTWKGERVWINKQLAERYHVTKTAIGNRMKVMIPFMTEGVDYFVLYGENRYAFIQENNGLVTTASKIMLFCKSWVDKLDIHYHYGDSTGAVPVNIEKDEPMEMPDRIEYKGQVVMTTKQVALFYNVKESVITNNFNRNTSKYEAGKHYLRLEDDDLKEFKSFTSKRDVAPEAPYIYIWTKRGVLKLCQHLTGHEANKVMERLIDDHFALEKIVTGNLDLSNSSDDVLERLAQAGKGIIEAVEYAKSERELRIEAEKETEDERRRRIEAEKESEKKDKVIEEKDDVIKITKPKAEKLDKLLAGIEYGISINDFSSIAANFCPYLKSKNIADGRNKMFKYLRILGIYPDGSTTPYQAYRNRGWFVPKFMTLENGKPYTKYLITPEGIKHILDILEREEEALMKHFDLDEYKEDKEDKENSDKNVNKDDNEDKENHGH